MLFPIVWMLIAGELYWPTHVIVIYQPIFPGCNINVAYGCAISVSMIAVRQPFVVDQY